MLVDYLALRLFGAARWLLTVLFLASYALAQPTLESGAPFVKHYSLKEEQIHPQNWSLALDGRGFLYSANVEGVVEFDGTHWRVISVEGRRVRSIARGADGHIYVGGEGAFGRLEADSKGLLEYRSLLDQLPAQAKEFANVYQLVALGEMLYLNTGNHLIRYGKGGSRAWPASVPDAYHAAFGANGRLYVRENGVGLRALVNDALVTVEGGELFATMEARIDAVLPYNERRLLLATRNKGLYLYDEALGLQPLPSTLAPFLRDNQLYCGAALPNGEFAFGTLSGGVAVVSRTGEWVRTIDRADFLPPGKVYGLLCDPQGSLWLALDRGLVHVEYPAAITRFDDRRGLEGGVLASVRHRGVLYAATSTGVFRLKPGTRAEFELLPGLRSQAWHLIVVEGSLLVATTQGVYEMVGNQLRPLPGNDDKTAAFFLLPAKHDPKRIYVGRFNGIAILERGAGGWVMVGQLPGVVGQVNWLAESPTPGPGGSTALWFGDAITGLQRALIYTNAEAQLEVFGMQEGLPSSNGTRGFAVGNDVVFTTSAGLYSYTEATRKFAKAAPLGTEFSRVERDVKWLLSDTLGTTWAFTYQGSEGGRLWQLKRYGQVVRPQRTPLGRVSRLALTRAYSDALADGGALWLASDEGLLRYDPSVKKAYLAPFAAAVRSAARLNDTTGVGVIYAGARADSASGGLRVPFDYNSLRFTVAAPVFDESPATEFQYRLEPLETNWGRWTNEDYRDYTNLFEGSYTLRVRARDVYGNVAKEDALTFTIETPWFRTWLAYLVYFLLVLGALFAAFRWRLQQLEERNRILEKKVQERTAELQKANTEILAQKAELENAYEEIRATNEQLEELLRELEAKNSDITDSIQYAKRIQDAILPPEHELAEALSDYFVLFKPRDIVSGDFYWFYRTESLTYLAAVDCTGHGVPGAFMSVMGNALLTEIIVQSGVRDTGEILTRLDARVQQTLRQLSGGSKSKDGMEVALICIDSKKREISFAGANRPLLYVRGGVPGEVPPDKVPIGGHAYSQMERYTTTILPYEAGDCFYTFSDGYGDQFGGEKGRKFMVKNFKDMVFAHYREPMTAQVERLGQTIDAWRGERSQNDDILVMGIRVS